MTVLVVDDSDLQRLLLTDALEGQGAKVVTACDANEALAAWSEHRGTIRFVLTDIDMPPGMNGGALGRELLRRDPELNIIYMSGRDKESLVREGTLTPEASFVPKPFPSGFLTSGLAELLACSIS